MLEAAEVIPPGRAIRTFNLHYKQTAVRGYASDEQRIRSGGYWIMSSNVAVMVRSGTLRGFEQDGVKYLELTDLGRKRMAYHVNGARYRPL